MYCILTDVHANLAALEAVMAAASSAGVQRYLFLGDAVGYGPDPNDCVRRIKSIATAAIAGNHDRAVIDKLDVSWFNEDARRAIEWTASQLEPALADYLESLPVKLVHDSILLVHGSPRDPVEEYVQDTWTAAANFHSEDFSLCYIGHSHIPVIFEQNPAGDVSMAEPVDGTILEFKPGHRYIINVGSVGQPRDRNPDAAFGIYDPDAGVIWFLRVAYPFEETQERMRKAGLPLPLADRLSFGS